MEDKMSRCRYRHPYFGTSTDKEVKNHCHVDGWENDNIKTISKDICENCDKFDSRFIEYPLTINGIENSKIEYNQECKLCEVQPCGEEYKGKTFVGILLGNLPIAITSSFDRKTKILNVSTMNNPAILVPKIGKIIFGCNSWWREIESVEDFSEISEEDIENTWYVQAMKEMFGNEKPDEKEET